MERKLFSIDTDVTRMPKQNRKYFSLDTNVPRMPPPPKIKNIFF